MLVVMLYVVLLFCSVESGVFSWVLVVKGRPDFSRQTLRELNF